MGWQERYFELQNGVLVYYKSESEKQFGSRGSITLRCANLQVSTLRIKFSSILSFFEVHWRYRNSSCILITILLYFCLFHEFILCRLIY